MSDSGSNLDDIVKSYLSTQDIYKQNDCRNSILLLVSSTNGSEFVTILDEIYEQNDDPADRQKILKLLHEIISRTENVFNFVQVVQFLLKCLKLTLCVHLSVNTMKSLLTRHFNNEDFTVYKSLQKFYDILLCKKMSQYPQQCRIDFLYISNFMLDSYLYGKIERPDVEMICDAISGEKDPRNLLIMFDLLTKLAKQVAKEPKEFEYISNTYSIYYPIQFVPPKKDKIRITPLQLKKKLLGCFASNVELAPFSIEILLDSLYSEFSVEDQHISVVSDTLYFLKRCKPLYGSQFRNFGKQLVEIIKSELLENNMDNKEKDNNNRKNKDNNKINNKDKDNLLYMLDNLSVNKVNGNDNTNNNKRVDIKEVNKIGRLYYKEWKYVDEKTKLFSEILRLFLESMEGLDVSELERFIRMLKNTLYTNYSIGYMIDVLCENSSFHCSVVDYVVIPLLEDIYKGFVDSKNLGSSQEKSDDLEVNSEVDTYKIKQQREGIMNILCMFILPMILVHYKGDVINEQLIVILLRIIDSNSGNNTGNNIKQENLKTLKLLLLSSCIVNTDLIDKQVKYIINKVFDNKEKDGSNSNRKNKDNNKINNNIITNGRTEESMYLEILIIIYKCHPDSCLEIVGLLELILNYDFKDSTYELVRNEDNGLSRFHDEYMDFREYIRRISYIRKDNRLCNVSLQVVEMFKISLRRFLDDYSNGYVNMSFVRKMMLLSFSCLKYIITYNRLFTRDNNNNEVHQYNSNKENILDLYMTYSSLIGMLYEFEDWSKGSEMLRSIISKDRLVEYYYGLVDYYKRAFYCNEESSFRLMFITSKVPRILSYLGRCVDIYSLRLFDSKKIDVKEYERNNNKLDNFRLEFLYLYNKDNNNSNINDSDRNDLDTNNMLNSKLNNDLELGLNLLNIEGYFMMKNCKYEEVNMDNNNNNTSNTIGNGNELKDFFDFEYFNGSMLVKYVHEMYRFDFKIMIEQIKMLNQYQVHNLEYEDLFFMVIPISFNNVRTILKYQMIDMRKLYKMKKKEIENIRDKESNNENNNNNINKYNNIYDMSPKSQISLTEIMDDRSKERRDKLMRILFEKMRNGDYESIPSYYSRYEIKNENYSRIELYVSFILLLLNKGVGYVEVEYIRVVLEDMDSMLDGVLTWMENNNENNNNTNKDNDSNNMNKIEVSEYITWCCDKYLLYLQTFIFGVLSNMNSGRYEVDEREEIKDLLMKKLDMLIRDLVRIYKGNQVPFCRILSILCIHSIITSKYIQMDRNMRMKVS